MYFKKKMLLNTLPFLLFCYCFPLYATYQGDGAVLMRGEILYTPCAIDLKSRDQTIDMGETPISEIATRGYGPSRAFTIQLINCLMFPRPEESLYDSEYYQITFEPMAGEERFVVHGEMLGVELTIRDAQGNLALPGVAMPAKEVILGDIDLHYSLQLVSNGLPLRSGDYQSLIRFRMDYY